MCICIQVCLWVGWKSRDEEGGACVSLSLGIMCCRVHASLELIRMHAHTRTHARTHVCTLKPPPSLNAHLHHTRLVASNLKCLDRHQQLTTYTHRGIWTTSASSSTSCGGRS